MPQIVHLVDLALLDAICFFNECFKSEMILQEGIDEERIRLGPISKRPNLTFQRFGDFNKFAFQSLIHFLFCEE